MNALPIALMCVFYLAPLVEYWLIVWGPLRPYSYPAGSFAPSLLSVMATLALAFGAAWTPITWLRPRRLERGGRFYTAIGVRWFRAFVTDGDLVNRWRRRTDPRFRVVTGRAALAALLQRTYASERGHLFWLVIGAATSIHAWGLGWRGWAIFLGVGNVIVNVYPILLQRYTRDRVWGVKGARGSRTSRARRRAPS